MSVAQRKHANVLTKAPMGQLRLSLELSLSYVTDLHNYSLCKLSSCYCRLLFKRAETEAGTLVYLISLNPLIWKNPVISTRILNFFSCYTCYRVRGKCNSRFIREKSVEKNKCWVLLRTFVNVKTPWRTYLRVFYSKAVSM